MTNAHVFKKQIAGFLVGFLVAFSSYGATAQNTCVDEFGESVVQPNPYLEMRGILRDFSEGWDQCYLAWECHDNVIRLYRLIKQNNPTVEPEDFKVLYVSPLPKDFGDDDITGLRARISYDTDGVSSGPTWWVYHVLLEYKGIVLDLDFTDRPRPRLVKKYFNEQFIDQDLRQKYQPPYSVNNVIVTVVPGDVYLKVHPNKLQMHNFRTIIENPELKHYRIKDYPDGEPIIVKKADIYRPF